MTNAADTRGGSLEGSREPGGESPQHPSPEGGPRIYNAKGRIWFGQLEFPCRYEGSGFSFGIEQDGGMYTYRRDCGNSRTEKTVSCTGAALFVHPVEPVNLPREVTRFLEIEFPPVMMEPDSERTIYLTFPVEIGVILRKNEEYHLLDVFTLETPKYSLYGSPESGVITRFCQSGVSDRPVVADPARSGIMRLTLRNTSKGWVEAGRAVFESYFMPIFFGEFSALSAQMVIFSREIAETSFVEQPLLPEMRPAIPLVTARKILFIDTERKRFLMEYGVR